MDLVIETISKCSDEYDDNVQLQVIKALLTAVTSVYCEVHEASLLLAIRSCFHIHLISKNQVNKTTAKAALTQMLSVVNQRMETIDAKTQAETEAALTAMSNDHASIFKKLESPILTINTPIAEFSEENSPTVFDLANNEGVLNAELLALANAEGFPDMNKDSGSGAERVALPKLHDVASGAETSTSPMTFPSIMHKDAFLLFRALCKLSMKGLFDDSVVAASAGLTDPIALQNKLLSLELILHILQRSGPAFRSGERFVYAVKHYLCVSLLGNCTSPVNQVTGLSLQIFISLMDSFKEHLKSEMEVFVTHIFLRILESEHSSFDSKMRVLEVFHIICADPSAMVEIFINYDCELDTIDLFKRMVAGFSKIAKNPTTSSRGNSTVDFMSTSKRLQSEELSLRMKGVEGLVIVLRSLLRAANLWQGIGEPAPSANIVNTSSHALSDLAPADSAETADEDKAPLSPPPSSSLAVEVFDRKKKIHEEIETGILKFNLSPKKGLAYLVSLGHVEHTPKGVANFLRQYQDRLDKTVVGDYLGREREYENGFCLEVLSEYVDEMNFAGMAFDQSIRFFLKGFRLPGEAQKIDRLMEKFAERYYLQNRDTFASADMAFILAFSTIMLQTNLHNPAIRDDKRMTKEQFLKQNKGISPDGELPDQMLMDIYDRIAAEPISITQNDKFKKNKAGADAANSFSVASLFTDKRKQDAFSNERKEMVKEGELEFKRKLVKRSSAFVRTDSSKVNHSSDCYIRPMFDVVWAPILGVLSQLLETFDDSTLIELCLTSFQYAIRLACRLDVAVARNTFVNTIAKLTTLDSVKEMQKKNVDAIKVLLDVALFEGDVLEESWSAVLQSVSQLARLQLFSNGGHTDDVFFGGQHSSSKRISRAIGDKQNNANSLAYIGMNIDNLTKIFTGPSRAEAVRQVEESNASLVSREIDGDYMVRIYTNSVSLSEESVIHFVRCLCEVSVLEITAASAMTSLRGSYSDDATTPRVFSLQKLVEVADFNMGSRARIAWQKIWNCLATHFTSIGCHENLALSMFAVDSLKQLSIKFLQKVELSNFNFQRVFLKPFEVIIVRSRSVETKDLVLRCLDIMIRACASNIRSGWKSIFSIFEAAASQEMELATIAFEIIERLIAQQFELLVYDFVELINCLVAFAAGPHTGLSLKALVHLSQCADQLAIGAVSPALDAPHTEPAATSATSSSKLSSHATAPAQSHAIDEEASVFRLWWPLLLGLSTKVGDARLPVRAKALDTLGQVLLKNGHVFSPHTWAVLFKGIMFPIIDSAQTDFTSQPESNWPGENPQPSNNRQSWIGTMALPAFNLYLELYQHFNDEVINTRLLPELLTMIESCVCQETESLARLALSSYSALVLSLGRGLQEKRLQRELEGEGHADQSFDIFTVDLITSRLSACLLRNLCLDFGPVGAVELLYEAPATVAELLPECPLLSRRRSKDGEGGTAPRPKPSTDPMLGRRLSTPYGAGTVVEALPPVSALQLGSRYRIALQCGASMFATDVDYPFLDTSAAPAKPLALSDPSSKPRLTGEQQWREIAQCAMTSMVISLDLLQVVNQVLKANFSMFSVDHFSTILSSLEVSMWHAKSFNDCVSLSFRLQQKRFMRFRDDPSRMPHLLQQEVLSANILLSASFQLYGVSVSEDQPAAVNEQQQDLLLFAAPWVERLGSLTCQTFIKLERLCDSFKLSAAAGGDNTRDFAYQQHQEYVVLAALVLRGICAFSTEQFLANIGWIVPLMPQLILCEDSKIRHLVSKIYTFHVNPLLLSQA